MTEQKLKLPSIDPRHGLVYVALLGGAAILDFAYDLRAEPSATVSTNISRTADGNTTSQDPAKSHEILLTVGDRIKVSFYKSMDVPQTKTANGAQPALRTFYQRLDLSGEYTIQGDGTISFPKLGAIRIAARSLRDAQLDIAAAFEKTIAGRCDVNILIVERQPIYIVGPVKAPGVYKLVPGMTVLHAIAVAGGMDHAAQQVSRVMDLLRERKEEEELRVKLARAVAQQARLKAERDGFEKSTDLIRLFEVAGKERLENLIQIVGKERARDLISAEGAALEQDYQNFKEAVIKRSEEIVRTKAELAMLESKVNSNSQRLLSRRKRLAMLQEAGASVLAATVNAAENEKLELEARHQETLLAIEHAKQKLAQMEREAAFSERDRVAKIIRETSANNEEISNLEKALLTTTAIGKVMERSIETQLDFGQKPPRIEIVRQGLENRQTLSADEATPLEPGDIVRIRPWSPDSNENDMAHASDQTF